MVKPTIAVPLTVRPTASLETDPAPAYGYGFNQAGAAGGMIPAFANMAISGSPAVYGATQPYGGHVVAPYSEAPLMTSPYSVDPVWNPYASIGQPYNAHQGLNSGYATHEHGHETYAPAYVAAPVYHSPPIYPEGYNNYEGAMTAATPGFPAQAHRNNSIANNRVSIPSPSTPTNTITTTNFGTPNTVNTVNTALTVPSPPPNSRNPPISLPITSSGPHPLQPHHQQQLPRTIVITGLTKKDLTPEKIRLLLSEHVSEVVAAQIQGIQISDRKEIVPQGHTAYVRFQTVEDAELAVAHLDQNLYGKNTLGVKLWVPERGPLFVGEGSGGNGGGGKEGEGGVGAAEGESGRGLEGSGDRGNKNSASKSGDDQPGKEKEKSGSEDTNDNDNKSKEGASGRATGTANAKSISTQATSTSAVALAVVPRQGHRRESTSGVVIANGSYTINTTTAEGAAVGKKDRSGSLSAMSKGDVVIARGSWATTKPPTKD